MIPMLQKKNKRPVTNQRTFSVMFIIDTPYFIPLLRDEEYPAACCACSWGLRSVIPRGLPRGRSFYEKKIM